MMETHLFEGCVLFMCKDKKAELHLRIAEGLQCLAGVEAHVSIWMSTFPNTLINMQEYAVSWCNV